MDDVKKLIGDRIRQLRKERGLSQERLGYESGLHYTHIGAIERGEKNWSIDTLVKVAEGLNVTVNDLLTLPSKSEDTKILKKMLIEEIDESSPEALKLFMVMIRGFKSLHVTSTIQKLKKNK